MRVVYVSPHATRGGAERVTMDLVALHKRGAFEPAVLFLRDGPLVEEARTLGVPAEVMVAPRLREIAQAAAFKRALAGTLVALKADLVHGVMAWGHAYAGAAAHRARLPAVWYQHNIPEWRRAEDFLSALVPARRILANSALTARAQRRFNPRRVPIDVVYPGVRLPGERREARWARGRRALGLSDDAFAVGIVARLVQGKGHTTFLRAAQSLCNARADARIVVAGAALFGLDQDYPEELRRLSASLGIEKRTRFIGMTVAASEVLSALDVAVHVPERVESFGLAVIEAMAAGAAVVASDIGPIREIVDAGTTAVVVPPGDHEALATAFLALHDDPAARRGLVEAADQRVRERFDARRTTKKVEAIYRAVCQR